MGLTGEPPEESGGTDAGHAVEVVDAGLELAGVRPTGSKLEAGDRLCPLVESGDALEEVRRPRVEGRKATGVLAGGDLAGLVGPPRLGVVLVDGLGAVAELPRAIGHGLGTFAFVLGLELCLERRVLEGGLDLFARGEEDGRELLADANVDLCLC